MIRVEDKRLALPDGRILAYADNGNTSSATVVIYFHGAFGVGDASRPPPILLERNVHFVAPSLPGWGKSSPVRNPSFYATTLATDITALIIHLHPQGSKLSIYLCGLGFGTVAAQILYSLSHDTFPLGRQIVGAILLAPHSPPHHDKEYAKSMSWKTYLIAGPPSRYVPFNLIARLAKLYIANRMASEAAVELYIRQTALDSMGEEEREAYTRWREEVGVQEGQLEREMAGNLIRSVAQSWRGFLDIPAIYHSGWGAFQGKVDEGSSNLPVLVVTAKRDRLVSGVMSNWLATNCKSTTLKIIDGGFLSLVFGLNDIWKEVLS